MKKNTLRKVYEDDAHVASAEQAHEAIVNLTDGEVAKLRLVALSFTSARVQRDVRDADDLLQMANLRTLEGKKRYNLEGAPFKAAPKLNNYYRKGL